MAGCEERGGDGGGGEGEADEAPFRVGFLDEEGGGDEQTEDGPCREEGSGTGGGRSVAPAQGEEVEGEWWDEPAVAVVVRVGPVPAHLEDGDEEADEGWQEGEPRADGGWLAGKWHVVEGGMSGLGGGGANAKRKPMDAGENGGARGGWGLDGIGN